MSNIILSPLGLKISSLAQGKISKSNISALEVQQGFQNNFERWKVLMSLPISCPNLIIVGPGIIEDSTICAINNCRSNGDAIVLCTQWSNFRDDLECDLLASCHVLPLMASLNYRAKPRALIHGVYSKVPPILKKSCTVRWSDPYICNKSNNIIEPHSLIDDWPNQRLKNIPYISIPRNAMSFCLFMGLYLGFSRITLSGFDPLNPSYFFEEKLHKKLEIAESVIQSDPWISAWDGRNERLPPKPDTIHRQLNSLKKFLIRKTKSPVGSGWRLEEMSRGLRLSLEIAQLKTVSVDYIGVSSFMSHHNINKGCI